MKLKKCSLIKSEVTVLGHVQCAEGVLPNPDNVEKLVKWQAPTRVRDLRAFLGLANYYRRFVKDYSKLVKPLTELTRKDVCFRWTSECQEAFDQVKTILLGPEIMAYPTVDGPWYLDCDASGVSLGAVLSQLQDGRERVVAYGSRTLSRTERN